MPGERTVTSPILEKDPVCGMNVNPATAKHVREHAGKKFYFCCAGCAEKFHADPQKYLQPRPASGLVTLGAAPSPRVQIAAASKQPGTAHVCPMCPEVRESKPGACPSCGMALEPEIPLPRTRTEYTCPMHPEIVRPGPGSCPICGMALEPRTVTAEQEENPELRDMTHRFWLSLILTVPLLGIAMVHMLPGMPVQHAFPQGWLPWIELILATPVVLWAGWPFFQCGWASIIN